MIATGTTANDRAPTNPATGKPYFTVRALGWGSAGRPASVAVQHHRCAVTGLGRAHDSTRPETVTRDAFTLLVRGDVDRP
ncbi:MAG: hypothetical protein IPK27_09865 [Rhodanobacteraceae bacterium]|nr:hypothetical protein [Rhodanobacteraceae bacterium]